MSKILTPIKVSGKTLLTLVELGFPNIDGQYMLYKTISPTNRAKQGKKMNI